METPPEKPRHASAVTSNVQEQLENAGTKPKRKAKAKKKKPAKKK